VPTAARTPWLPALAVAWLASQATAAPAPDAAELERGAYLVAAGGCVSCHTADHPDAPPLAGGRALATPFGTFYAPNITPDRDTGIGRWSVDDVVRALREGRRPDGQPYFPAFPYTAYAGLTEDDARAIGAWLLAQPAVRQAVPEHDLQWFLQSRWVMLAWNFLNFTPGAFTPDPARDAAWNRGAYLVRHLGHCGECHTPRNWLGGTDRSRELAGNPAGPEDAVVPNITPDTDTGIGAWSQDELVMFLGMGMTPDGDFTGASMGSVITDNTSRLTDGDRTAIATYLQSLPALPAVR
jgi:mono/diheme cytochrome c family protein